MRASIVILAILAAVAANPKGGERIMGGDLTTIDVYPFAASLLSSANLVTFNQHCGGAIINIRSILTAAYCIHTRTNNQLQVRVGSSYSNYLGFVYTAELIIVNPNFNPNTFDSDIGILRTFSTITYVINAVAPASIASYEMPDDQLLWAIGWGALYAGGPVSEQLRHVQLWSINQNICRIRYADIGWTVTDNMLCSGWLDIGGRGQCAQDVGSPLLHNSVIVGLYSFSFQCGHPSYPSINTRISRYIAWIQVNA